MLRIDRVLRVTGAGDLTLSGAVGIIPEAFSTVRMQGEARELRLHSKTQLQNEVGW